MVRTRRKNRRSRRRRQRGGCTKPLKFGPYPAPSSLLGRKQSGGRRRRRRSRRRRRTHHRRRRRTRQRTRHRRRRSRRSRRHRRRQRGGSGLKQFIYPLIPSEILDVGFNASNGLKNLYAGYVGEKGVASANPIKQPIGRKVEIIGGKSRSDANLVLMAK